MAKTSKLAMKSNETLEQFKARLLGKFIKSSQEVELLEAKVEITKNIGEVMLKLQVAMAQQKEVARALANAESIVRAKEEV